MYLQGPVGKQNGQANINIFLFPFIHCSIIWVETNTSFEMLAWAPCFLHFDLSLAPTTGLQQQRTEQNLEIQEMLTYFT